MNVEREIARRLRERTDLLLMPAGRRRREIQLAIMDTPGLDPDSEDLIRRLDAQVSRVLWRVKGVTNLRDDELAGIIGKSRATIQAYVAGRLEEKLSVKACDRLLVLLDQKAAEIDALKRDVNILRSIADE